MACARPRFALKHLARIHDVEALLYRLPKPLPARRGALVLGPLLIVADPAIAGVLAFTTCSPPTRHGGGGSPVGAFRRTTQPVSAQAAG